MPSRRRVLAHAAGIGAAAALTGCVLDTSNDSSLSLHLEHVPRERLGQRIATPVEDLRPRARETAVAGLANGTTAHGRPPLAAGEVVVADGTYYEVQVSQNGTATVERPVVAAEAVSAPDGPVGDWGGLSRSDAEALRCAVATRDEPDGRPCVLLRGEDSDFWPEPRFRYLATGGEDDRRYFRLSVSERSVSLEQYEYRFEAVARNRSAFADHVARTRVAVDFSTVELSEDQRAILETAASEGVYRESPPPFSDALRDLVRRIRAAGDRGPVYVRFDGRYYRAVTRRTYDD